MFIRDNGGVFMLIQNFVKNAIRHAPPGSAVIIQLEMDALSVCDGGFGNSAVGMPFIVDRFWRGKHRHDAGAGLGLSICLKTYEAHGWRIEIEHMAPGPWFSVIFA